MNSCKKLGIDIGSTTVKVSIIEDGGTLLFADYKRHFANIQETLADLLREGEEKLGALTVEPVITGSGGLTLSKHLGIPFVQEVVAVATSLKDYAPQTDVAIELGGEDAKIIYFTGGIDQRMNGIMKQLTIVSTIFIPLTFLAGIWGMNFSWMPELNWKYGYLFAWILMLVTGTAVYLLFRRKKWY